MFTENNDVRLVGAPVAAGSAIDSNSTRVDALGYEQITFICPIDDSVATGVAHLKIEANDVDSDGGMVAIDGADATVTCAVNDDVNGKLLVVTVKRPRKRFIQAVRTSSVANIAFGSVVAILSDAKKAPVPTHSTVADVAAVVG